MMKNPLMIAALTALLALPVMAQDDSGRQMPDGSLMRADDLVRLNGLNDSMGQAMRRALAEGAPEDIAQLTEALRGTPLPSDEAMAALAGDWSCQMIKIGGLSALIVYQPFDCRAEADGRFDKLTGSQRTTGHVQDWQGQLTYLGTAYVVGEKPIPYGDFPETLSPAMLGAQSPDVGLVELVDADTGRILLPAPHVESLFNLLVLRR